MRDMGIPEDDINGKFSISLKLWPSHEQFNVRKGNGMSLNQTVPSDLPGHNKYLLNVHMLVILTWREPFTKPLACLWICFLSYFPPFFSLSITPTIYVSIFLFSLSFISLFPIPLSLQHSLHCSCMCCISPSISHLLALVYTISLCSCVISLLMVFLYSFLVSPFPCSVCCPSVWQHGLQAREKFRTSHHAE